MQKLAETLGINKNEYEKIINMKTGKSRLLIGKIEDILKWSESNSLWFLTLGLACCDIEMMGTNASHYDLDRMGVIPRNSPSKRTL